VNTIIVNNGDIPEELLEKYKQELSTPVLCDSERLQQLGIDIIEAELVKYDDDDVVRHDTLRLASILCSLL
jgi:2-phospho-L-lactate transferase/gluconeogenesis factor (CofD/UPF0052 family)